MSDIKDDPVLRQTAETAEKATAENKKQSSASTKSKKEGTTSLDSEFVKVDQLPPDTQCRKVTTELEAKPKKGAKQTADAKSSNTSILCRTSSGEWKPAST